MEKGGKRGVHASVPNMYSEMIKRLLAPTSISGGVVYGGYLKVTNAVQNKPLGRIQVAEYDLLF